MTKRFKLKICRVIATTLQSCRSKDPSSLPKDPVPSFLPPSKFSNAKSHIPAATFNHHVSSAFISIDGLTPKQPQQFRWQKEEKWHVVAKIHQPRLKIYDSAQDLTFTQPAPPTPPPTSSAEKNRRRRKKKKKIPSRLRLMSTSSADSGWFSSEGGGGGGGEETETLVSSSLSLSPELNPRSQLQPIRETQPITTNLQRTKRRSYSSKRSVVAASAQAVEGNETPARLSMFKKLIPCTVDGKVKESFAIVKRSEDPYEDFKNSMMDMIVEKQMFDQKDLEQLLQCFLSLNSSHYHGIILEAFSEAILNFSSKPLPHHR